MWRLNWWPFPVSFLLNNLSQESSMLPNGQASLIFFHKRDWKSVTKPRNQGSTWRRQTWTTAETIISLGLRRKTSQESHGGTHKTSLGAALKTSFKWTVLVSYSSSKVSCLWKVSLISRTLSVSQNLFSALHFQKVSRCLSGLTITTAQFTDS